MNRAVVGEIHLRRLLGLGIHIDDMPLFRWPMVDDFLLRLGQVFERHIRAHPHLPTDVLHEGPHEGPPDGHGPLVDGQVFVGHQGRLVHGPGDAGPSATRAGSPTVEGQVFGPRPIEFLCADGAGDLLHSGHSEGRRAVMTLGATMAGQTGEHETQAVQQLRHGAESAADPGDARPLVKGQSRRNITDLVHIRSGCLGHASAGISGQGFQIPPGPFGVEDTQGQG